MGSELGDPSEWNHDGGVPWDLLQSPRHAGLQNFVRALNHFHRSEPALYQQDFSHGGFEWIDISDVDKSVISFLRRGLPITDGNSPVVIFACNFTPIPRHQYRIGVPSGGHYREAFNSDAECYGGTNTGNPGGAQAEGLPHHARPYSISITLPPLAVVAYIPVDNKSV